MTKKSLATIHISDLKLRAIIGANDWERDHKQDLIINVAMTFDATAARKSDDLKDTVDYKTISKKIITSVEKSKFFLIEKLADTILKICMANKAVQTAEVCVDKPFALRFADSVSITVTDSRSD